MEKQSRSEEIGAEIRNSGLIAGVLGIILAAEAIVMPAFGLAMVGEIYRRTGKVRSST